MTESVAALSYRRTERTSLVIETQEGDVVKLKIKVRDALDAAATAGGDTEVADLTVQAQSSVKIRFSVEGNLNAEELAAIQSVVEQASALAEEFFAGDAPAAFATAQGLQFDGAELARVGLRFSVRERLTYSAYGTLVPMTPQAPPSSALPGAPEPAAPTPIAAPAPAVAAPAPVAAEPATLPSAAAPAPVAAAPVATTAPTSPTPNNPPTAPAEPPRPLNVASQALSAIADFVTELLESLTTPDEGESEGSSISVDLSLKLRVFQSVVVHLAASQLAEPAAADEPTTGVPLLVETLDALAAREQRLDTHV